MKIIICNLCQFLQILRQAFMRNNSGENFKLVSNCTKNYVLWKSCKRLNRECILEIRGHIGGQFPKDEGLLRVLGTIDILGHGNCFEHKN